jgi:hypothetical protein
VAKEEEGEGREGGREGWRPREEKAAEMALIVVVEEE